MNKKLLSLYSLKYNPFSPQVPVESLLVSSAIEHFCWRVESQLVSEGGFALLTGDPGMGKSVTLRLLASRLSTQRDISVGVLSHATSNIADFYRAMPKRLERFNLQVAPEKTALRRFSRFSPTLVNRFQFLSMEFYWDTDYYGQLRVKKRTAPKRLQAAKQEIKDWIKKNRHLKGQKFVTALNRRLVGHYNYFGLRSNESGIGSFFRFAIGCAFKWLNRRGGKKKSFNWDQFRAALDRLGVARPICRDRQREHRVLA